VNFATTPEIQNASPNDPERFRKNPEKTWRLSAVDFGLKIGEAIPFDSQAQ
jgi:hypothetical protein